MSVTRDDLASLFTGPDAEARAAAAWSDASRVLSPSGLERWVRGAEALQSLGRGQDVVDNFIEQAPAVARELGDEIIGDLMHAALSMASKTSGTIISLVIATAPTAARRLGDADLFRSYLEFLSKLLALAPRGLRPMLENLDKLFSQLTLGGLRRWAMWGGQAHRTDYPAQELYFSLQSPDSLGMLQNERKGTLFIDVQRRLTMYLRALWGRDFFLRPTSGDWESREGLRPYIENFTIHIADAYDTVDIGNGPITGMDMYRAAAAHAAAHVVATQEPISGEGLNLLQRACIGLMEDARVERLAINKFPGLAQLWQRLHVGNPASPERIGTLLERVARALIDPAYQDDHPLIARIRLLFAERLNDLESNQVAWDIGVTLAHDLMQMSPTPYNPRSDIPNIPYRDDNRYIWEFDEASNFANGGVPWEEKQIRKYVNVMEFVNEVEVETAGDDAQEIWVLGSELLDDDGTSWNEREGKPPAPTPHHYNEWDYQIQLERPNWVTVLERPVELGNPQTMDDLVGRNKPVVARLKRVIELLQPQGVQRMRKQEDGDDLDLNVAIDSCIDIRMGRQPDPRIMMRRKLHVRDVSSLLLIDLSESTGDTLPGTDRTVLSLAQEATALLSDAINRLGDRFALHGFASDGRHDVSYNCFKDFNEPYGERVKAKLDSMKSGFSTRMGAALRHAGSHLARQASRKKLLLVLTDGEPADVDVRDPQYLRADTKKAVEELGRNGITTFCISLDPRADQYVARIFGSNRYFVLDDVQRLPEKLPSLFLGLTR